MSEAERWARLKELVARACELEGDEREAFLAAQVADDAALLARARELLEHEDAARALLGGSVAADPARFLPELAGLAVGARIGSYEVLGVLGHGGSSTVYVAMQASPPRKVALKVLARAASAEDGREDPRRRDALRRFENESALLAGLDHPGIAKVFEAATETSDGETLAFMAIEWVEGARSIVQYCAEEGLDPRQRVELLTQVCDAVEHGHTRGVMHRDLKPANLLVDRDGRPKVIDFGIARVVDEAGDGRERTLAGSILGTVAYMSPEQCRGATGALDTRTDVYSLGVVLYELLCGDLPHDVAGKSFTAAVRAVQEEPPVRPSARRPGLARDLELVLLKALEKDPDRRYSTAGGLAADLRRFLRHEPVTAAPPSAWRELCLLVRRNRVAASAVAGLVLLAGASAAAGVFHAREVASVERAERARAQKVTAFLSGLLTLADPSVTDPSGLTLRAVLDDASERVDRELGASPEACAEVHATLGSAYRELGHFEKAERHHARQVELYREIHAGDPVAVACALHAHGHVLVSAGRAAEARGVLLEALRLHDRGDDAPPFLRAIAINHLARAHLQLGELDAAEERAAAALEVYRAAFGDEHEAVARATQTLAEIALARGEAEPALRLADRFLALDLENHGPDSLQVARARLFRAEVLALAGRFQEGLADVERAREHMLRVLPTSHHDLLRAEEWARRLADR